MTAFATVEEFSEFVGVDVPNPARAAMLLDMASDTIRGEARQTLSLVTDEEILVNPERGDIPVLLLPELPVVDITSIEVDGVALTEGTDYLWSSASGIVWRLGGSTWGPPEEAVEVKYTHGYAAIPGDIRGVCLAAAGRAYTLRERAESETFSGLTEQRGVSPEIVLTAAERRILLRYRP